MFEESESEEFRMNKKRMDRLTAQKEEASRDRVQEITNDSQSLSEGNPSASEDPAPASQEEEEILTADEVQQLISEANEHKNEGNNFFRDGLYEAALHEYTKALEICPKREQVRSVYFGNRSACYQNLLEYEKVVSDCTAALELDSQYLKVLIRRADAFERLDKLTEALEGTRTLRSYHTSH